MNDPTVILATAIDIECRALRNVLDDPRAVATGGLQGYRGLVGNVPTWILKTGIGPERAEQAARIMLAARPQVLVATGLAGALSGAIRPGALILAHEVRHGAAKGAPSVHPAPGLLATARSSIGGSRISTTTGILLTVETPARRPRDKAALAAATGAIAVDMESAALLVAAAASGVPALALRGISDGARDSLPDFGEADPEELGTQLRLAGRALLRPRKLRNLIGIALGTRRALKRLQAAHRALVPALARTVNHGY